LLNIRKFKYSLVVSYMRERERERERGVNMISPYGGKVSVVG
jgi:hypothetical protein